MCNPDYDNGELEDDIMQQMMALAENDSDEEETFESIAEFEKAFDEIRNSEQIKNVSVEKIDSGVVPRSLLEQVKEKGPEIKSLLGRQE